MKITWNQNPFWTTVELDDRDKQMILLAYQNEAYSDLLCDISFDVNGKFNRPKITDVEAIKERVNKWETICGLGVDSPEIEQYISFIKETHFGDCTCVPCSCVRFDTLKGLGKHEASKVLGSFGKEGDRTIDEAIASLEQPTSYVKTEVWKAFTQEQYESHIPRWENERVKAIAWLKAYKGEHEF